MEKHFKVRWEIDIYAESALEAAVEAHKIMLDEDSEATAFEVESSEEITPVDLEQEWYNGNAPKGIVK